MSETAMVQDLERLATLADAAHPAAETTKPSKHKGRKAAASAQPAEAAPVFSDGTDAETGCPDQDTRTDSSTPGIEERPCFKVLTDWTERTAQDGQAKGRRRPGVWHFGIKWGKGDAPPELTEAHVCGPLVIEAVTTDSHGGNFGRLLSLCNTLGTWRTYAMGMELLAGSGELLRAELLAMGLDLNICARDKLPIYLTWETPTRRVLCTLQTGWAGPKFDAFVLPARVIGPGAGRRGVPRRARRGRVRHGGQPGGLARRNRAAGRGQPGAGPGAVRCIRWARAGPVQCRGRRRALGRRQFHRQDHGRRSGRFSLGRRPLQAKLARDGERHGRRGGAVQ